MSAEKRLQELGLELPSPSQPIASYVTFRRTGNIGYISGHGAQREDGSWVSGRVGESFDLDQACAAAKATGLGILAMIRESLGSLDEVAHFVKVVGLVNCTPDFTDHMTVINVCSDLFIDVFGESGRHARSVIGVPSLPLNLPVEIEVIIEIKGE